MILKKTSNVALKRHNCAHNYVVRSSVYANAAKNKESSVQQLLHGVLSLGCTSVILSRFVCFIFMYSVGCKPGMRLVHALGVHFVEV